MSRSITIAIISVLLIILSIFIAKKIIDSKPEPPKKSMPQNIKYAETVKVKYQDHQSKIYATGRLRSANRTKIISEVQGRMIESQKDFKSGAYFSKGSNLIQIDIRELENQIKSQKASFLSSLTKILPSIKLDHSKYYSEWDEYVKSFEFDGSIKELPTDYDDNLKLFLANRNIFSSFFNIKNLEIQREKYIIKAPFNASVISSNIEKGGLIVPGQVLGEIVELNNYELELQIPDDQSRHVNISDKVEISNSEGDKSWSGMIIRKSKNLDYNTQTRSVFVKVEAKDLVDGTYLNAYISGNTLENTFKINRSSIVNNQFVNILNDSSRLERKRIDVLLTNDKFAFIRGLDSNTVVVDQALPNVSLGTKILDLSTEEASN